MRTSIVVALIVLSISTVDAAVTGRVTDEEGSPLAGIVVEVFRAESSEEFTSRIVSERPDSVPLATTKTANDGSFSADTGDATAVALLVDRRVVRRAVDGVDAGLITLAPARSITGRITAAGKPVAGAVVVLDRFLVIRSDSEGRYEASQTLADGMTVFHRDFAIRDREFSMRGPTHDIELRRSEPVSGRVVAVDGKNAAANAIIYVNEWPLARSGEDGTFTITNAPAGWTKLSARLGNDVGNINRSSKPPHVLRLRRGATVRGVVRDAKSNLPLHGALVPLHEPAGRNSRYVVSDRKGNYEITAVTPGEGLLAASRPGYATAQVGSVRITEGSTTERAIALMPLARVRGVVTDEQRKPVGGASIVAGPERTFTAADGSFDIGLAIPSLIVRKAGYAVTPHGPLMIEPGETKRGVAIVLSRGRAFRVQLVNPAGDGIADEPVIISRVSEDSMSPPIQLCSRDCITSSNGEFTLRLVDGIYDITAGGRRVPTASARRYTLAPGSTELTLRAPLGVKVSGRVVGGSGTTISDETIMVLVRNAGGPQTLSTRADPGGTFTLSNVPAGKVTLVAQRMLANSPPVTGPEVEVTAPANDVALQLPPVTLVRGRVLSKETREPVRDFSVWIRRYRGSGSTGYSQAFTTEDGSFAIDIAGAPSVDLTVTAPGHSPSVLANVNAEERSEPLQVLLDRGGSIKGRVTKRSQPVIDAMIRVQSPTQTQFNMGRPVRTDANGEFILDGLAPGEHAVHVTKPGHVAAMKTLEVRAGDAAQLDIEMSEGRTVRGRVIDSEGRPVEGARVTPRVVANRMASPTFAQTDVQGSFTLEGLEEGAATIIAQKSGFMEGTADVEASQPAAITITLARGGTVRGRIIGLDPSELPRVRIHSFSGAGRPADTQPDSNGDFVLSGLRDGMAMVTASIDFPARRSQSKQVEVRTGTADPVEFDFGQGFIVTGRVRRGGAAVPEAGVVFRKSRSMTEPGRALTGPDGSYRLQIEAGTYDVVINIGQSAFDVGQVTVSSAMTRDFDVRGGTLTGRVVAAGSSAPVAGVTVRATRIGGGSPGPGVGGRVTGPGVMLVTDSEGKFHAGVVDAGRYRLHATGHRYAPAQEEVAVRDDEVASVEIRLHEGETVRLRVLDAMTQRPIDGAAVTVYDAAKKIVESGLPFRQDDGAYRLSLLPGKYTARIWTSEHAPEMVDLLVPGPDAVAMMHRAGTVTLQGNRPGATRARLLDSATRKQIAMTGLSPGVFRQIRPGSYVIEVVDAKGAKLVERPVTVAAGQTITVSIE